MNIEHAQYDRIQPGSDLGKLRKSAKLSQAKVASDSGVDTSRLSRIETNDLEPTTKEITDIASAIGGDALDYLEFFNLPWENGQKPSYWHPARTDLVTAQQHLNGLKDFEVAVQGDSIVTAQIKLYRESLFDAIDFLRRLDHPVAFVGEIGAGKTTVICAVTGLLLPPAKHHSSLSQRVILDSGSGRVTLCENQIRQGASGCYGLSVQPHSEEEVFRSVSDFSQSLIDEQEDASSELQGKERRSVPEELGKAIRNMAGLTRRQSKDNEGNSVTSDPAAELAKKHKGDVTGLTAEVLKMMRLDARTKTEMTFEEPDSLLGLQKLRDVFTKVNKGLAAEFPLPRRIDVMVPTEVLDEASLELRVIDTKGVDETAIRPDLRAYLDDQRTMTVLCSRFNSAPDGSIRQFIENAANTGSDRALSERVVLLVLARQSEVMDTQDDIGDRVGTPEEGYRIKGDQVKRALTGVKAAKDIPLTFFDVANDHPKKLTAILAGKVSQMREAHSQRIKEICSAVDELIKTHGEEKTREAQTEVNQRLRIFVKQNLNLGELPANLHASFLSTADNTHVRTVWASTRRNGVWQGLHAYHLLGNGTALLTQSRSKPVFEALDGLLVNMVGDERFAPAFDYLNELRRATKSWRERFVAEARSCGREIFHANMYGDPVWSECVDHWTGGRGFRDRVVATLREWFESNQPLQDLIIGRIQKAWLEDFILSLAQLCGAEDLVTEKST